MLPNSTAGATCAINRNDSAAGLWVLRTRVAATASAYVQSPRFDTACADHKRMKVRRWKSGRNCPDPEGTRPEPPTRWIATAGGSRDVGRITSGVRSFELGRPIALGFVRREHATPGAAVRIRSDGGELAARVTALPFVRGV